MKVISAPTRNWAKIRCGAIVVEVDVTCLDCGHIGKETISGGELFIGAFFYICPNCGSRHMASRKSRHLRGNSCQPQP